MKIDITRRPEETDAQYQVRLRKIEGLLRDLASKKKYRAIDLFEPYPKQREFFDNGSIYKERMLSAGNQMGKTKAGCAETVYHLTGEYPDDWLGRRFDHPTKGWAASVSGLATRDGIQTQLLGEPGIVDLLGTGLIPKDKIIGKPSTMRGVTDAIDTVHIRHVSGGISTLTFKSYEQGREKFQSKTLDFVYLDEEPEEDIYTECLARVSATGGIVYVTFTPLHGVTKLWQRFNPGTYPTCMRTAMDINDAKHFEDPKRRAELLSQYPEHERASRIHGAPMQGTGLVFRIPEEQITEATIPFARVPPHWHKLWAMDFGINEDHKFAAGLFAWDKDTDILHLLHAFKVANQTVVQNAAMLKQIAVLVPVAWPHDGHKRESDGEEVATIYRSNGLKMLPEHATFETGGYSTEAGVLEMDERFKAGKLKVAAHLSDWFEEFRFYHRDKGLIVKKNDDLMSMTRIGVMARRFAKPVLLGPRKPVRPSGAIICDGAELSAQDLWG